MYVKLFHLLLVLEPDADKAIRKRRRRGNGGSKGKLEPLRMNRKDSYPLRSHYPQATTGMGGTLQGKLAPFFAELSTHLVHESKNLKAEMQRKLELSRLVIYST